MNVRLEMENEETSEKKPSFFAKHKDKILTAGAAAAGAVVTFVVIALMGKDGKDTIDAAEEDWNSRRQFEDSVDGSFDGSDL